MIDVTVHGAGVFGLSVAWACARAGARVRVVDPHGPGAGASGGVVGALAPHAPEQWTDAKAFQLESLLMAEDWWAAVAAAGGVDPGLARSGRVQPLADAAAVVRARDRAVSADALWRGRAAWRVAAAAEFALAPVSATGLVAHDTLSGRIAPARACAALVAAVRARGGTVGSGGGEAGAVVHATGWQGLAGISPGARAAGQGVKGQAAVLGFAAPDAPQVYADGLHIVFHADGTTAVGSTTERVFDDPASTDAQLDDVIARARAALPALRDAPVLRRWAGVRPRARTRAPMLGPWPGRPGHFVANGGFKTGFGMAPLAAEVLADLILERRDRIPDGFRVEASL